MALLLVVLLRFDTAAHCEVRNPGRPTITVDGRYAVSVQAPTTAGKAGVPNGEGEQVTANVREIY